MKNKIEKERLGAISRVLWRIQLKRIMFQREELCSGHLRSSLESFHTLTIRKKLASLFNAKWKMVSLKIKRMSCISSLIFVDTLKVLIILEKRQCKGMKLKKIRTRPRMLILIILTPLKRIMLISLTLVNVTTKTKFTTTI